MKPHQHMRTLVVETTDGLLPLLLEDLEVGAHMFQQLRFLLPNPSRCSTLFVLQGHRNLKELKAARPRLQAVINVHNIGPFISAIERAASLYHFSSNQNAPKSNPFHGARLFKQRPRHAILLFVRSLQDSTMEMGDPTVSKLSSCALNTAGFICPLCGVKQITGDHPGVRKGVAIRKERIVPRV